MVAETITSSVSSSPFILPYFLANFPDYPCFQIFEIDGEKYATDKDGSVFVNRSVKIDGRKYVATKDGTLATKGLVKVGKKYYTDSKGRIVTTKWVRVGKKKYYCSRSGRITKTVKISKKK